MPEKNGIPNRADILQRNTCTMLVLFHIYAITFQDNRFHVPKPTLLGNKTGSFALHNSPFWDAFLTC